jgi:hypothetical protein
MQGSQENAGMESRITAFKNGLALSRDLSLKRRMRKGDVIHTWESLVTSDEAGAEQLWEQKSDKKLLRKYKET